LLKITRLLCEDYIKLKGCLFFRLAAAIADSDESVSSLGDPQIPNFPLFHAEVAVHILSYSLFTASFCLSESLYQKDPTIFVSVSVFVGKIIALRLA
jgi:hypothetical protein